MTTLVQSHRPARGLTDDWLTPPDLLRHLGTFDLDPCCPMNMPWSTALGSIHYPESDGLGSWVECQR